jgi:PAS domain S-box-containing protein
MQIPEVVRLLLVEGSEKTSDFIKNKLSETKFTRFEISHVKTLKEAKKFNKINIDIVLLDLVLPNSEGIDTFKRLYGYCEDCPIIIISKYDDLGCDAVRHGAQDFLPPNDILTPGLLIRSVKYAIERKRLELEKLHIQGMYQEIVEKTHAAIYEICFRRNVLTYVNDVMCELTGWSREELLKMSISDVLTEQSRKNWIKRYMLMSQGKKVPNTFEYEVKIKNGSTVWCLITASYKMKRGIPVGARVIALDITDRKLAQIEAIYKEEQVYIELGKKLQVWKQESFITRQLQEKQLQAMDDRIMHISNGVV